jgi:hypothetical protein
VNYSFQVSITGAVDCTAVVTVEDWTEVWMDFNAKELAEFGEKCDGREHSK